MNNVIVQVKNKEEEETAFKAAANICLDAWFKKLIVSFLSLEDLIRVNSGEHQARQIFDRVGLEAKIINYDDATLFFILRNGKMIDFKQINFTCSKC